jgi:hypothetical protein
MRGQDSAGAAYGELELDVRSVECRCDWGQVGVESFLGGSGSGAGPQPGGEGPWHTRGQHQEASSAGIQAFTSDPINRPHRAVGSLLNVFAQFVESGTNDYLPDGS